MKKISAIASGLLLTSTLAFAGDTLDEAIKGGTVSGSLETYGIHTENKGGNPDTSMISGTVGLGYETDSYHGLSAKVSFLGVHVFHEKNDGDEDVEGNVIMQEANLNYQRDSFNLKVGRQELALEWLQDYHEAYVAETTALENTSILVGYSDKSAMADADEFSEGFTKFNGKKGIYFADVIYTGIQDTELNAYYYNAPDLGSLYGIKAGYYMDNLEIFTQYALTNEDTNSTFEDGSIFHIKADASLMGAPVSLGYVKTDKDGTGAVIGLELGDNINPFEDGNNVYEPDARTIYASIGYSIDDISLNVLYGQTKYQNEKEKELNISTEIEIIDDVLEVGLLFVNVDANNSNDDYQKYIFEVEYSF